MGGKVVAVGPGGQRAASAARRALRLNYTVVGDPARAAYDRFGFRRVLAVIQQSGVVIVDGGGVIRMLHRTTNPGAALPWGRVNGMLDVLAQAGSARTSCARDE